MTYLSRGKADQHANHLTGQKFEVTYLSEKQLLDIINSRAERSIEHPDEKLAEFDTEKFWAQCWLDILRDNAFGYEGRNLNELCHQVEPMDIEELLQKWWGKK